jgi:Protein of unknown function (DUF3455)
VKRILPALALLLAACASQPVEPPVPANLVPGEERMLERVSARGVQIYECHDKAGGEREWAFVAPRADLYDAQGHLMGKHYAGPHWEAHDGSKLLGTVKSRADSPVPGAIPWLLLSTRSVGERGRFAPVTSIQRLNTVGGAAPALPCEAGAKQEVHYTADYVFFGRAGS